MRRLPLLMLAIGLMGERPCPGAAQQVTGDSLHIDHIVVGFADLERGIAALKVATGVTARPGGVHPGRGTQNALLGLGPETYLELVVPSGEPDSSGTVAYLAGLSALSPGGWALAAPDLVDAISRLRKAGFTVTGPVPGSRRLPDGQVLRWETAYVVSDKTGLAPFLIKWEAGVRHPAASAPAGCRLSDVRLEAAEPGRLHDLLALLGNPATVDLAATSSLRFTLECPTGRVVIGE
jgi:Glyoxalase-like domain